MEDQMQKDTDAGMWAHIFAHPEEYLDDLIALSTV